MSVHYIVTLPISSTCQYKSYDGNAINLSNGTFTRVEQRILSPHISPYAEEGEFVFSATDQKYHHQLWDHLYLECMPENRTLNQPKSKRGTMAIAQVSEKTGLNASGAVDQIQKHHAAYQLVTQRWVESTPELHIIKQNLQRKWPSLK